MMFRLFEFHLSEVYVQNTNAMSNFVLLYTILGWNIISYEKS